MKIEKEHTKNTLMNRWSKEELVQHIMCLEHNNNVLNENFENQYKNCIKLLDDMKLVNDTYKKRGVEHD